MFALVIICMQQVVDLTLWWNPRGITIGHYQGYAALFCPFFKHFGVTTALYVSPVCPDGEQPICILVLFAIQLNIYLNTVYSTLQLHNVHHNLSHFKEESWACWVNVWVFNIRHWTLWIFLVNTGHSQGYLAEHEMGRIYFGYFTNTSGS